MSRAPAATRAPAAGRAPSIWRRNLATWVTLVLLVLLTLALAYLPLGRLNLPVALVIAAAKAALVAVVFMELRTGRPLFRLVAGAALFWIAIMFVLAFADIAMRAG